MPALTKKKQRSRIKNPRSRIKKTKFKNQKIKKMKIKGGASTSEPIPFIIKITIPMIVDTKKRDVVYFLIGNNLLQGQCDKIVSYCIDENGNNTQLITEYRHQGLMSYIERFDTAVITNWMYVSPRNVGNAVEHINESYIEQQELARGEENPENRTHYINRMRILKSLQPVEIEESVLHSILGGGERFHNLLYSLSSTIKVT